MRTTLFYATLCLCVFIFVFVAARILSHIWRKSDALGEWDSTAKYLAKSKHTKLNSKEKYALPYFPNII